MHGVFLFLSFSSQAVPLLNILTYCFVFKMFCFIMPGQPHNALMAIVCPVPDPKSRTEGRAAGS